LPRFVLVIGTLNPFGLYSPPLAANLSYRRKPVSRKPDWIPCQARNDGPGEKTIPRCLRRGRSLFEFVSDFDIRISNFTHATSANYPRHGSRFCLGAFFPLDLPSLCSLALSPDMAPVFLLSVTDLRSFPLLRSSPPFMK
jgi:hypothetical protein